MRLACANRTPDHRRGPAAHPAVVLREEMARNKDSHSPKPGEVAEHYASGYEADPGSYAADPGSYAADPGSVGYAADPGGVGHHSETGY